MRLDIGLVGATRIAERVVLHPAARHDDVTVRAVAASDHDRALAFAARNGIPVVHDHYADLIADPRINTVYISLHNSAHAGWAERAARAGKHVVVEKPLCLTPGELGRIREAAAEHGVRVAEALPSAGHPWQAAVREMIADRRYGPLRSIRTEIAFTTPAPGTYRTRPELGGGIFYDCAGYWLQAVQATAGLDGVSGEGRTVREAAATGDGIGVDLALHAGLRWADGRHADLDCRFGDRHVADHEFVFATATVRVRGFLRPIAGPLPVNLAIRRPGAGTRIRSFAPAAYYDRQFASIRDLLTTGDGGEGRELAAAAPRIAVMAAIHRGAARDGREAAVR
ncbi:Gfo/Idh/MocA family protein [Marinactinospora rubrisoli]|uniref:Gfo/Idh/MocA family protein n=1 Tax=Marinactinospora rubrisoli TaxID=2715399 RepID=A0ABW2KID3_9ACTN